VGSYRNNDTGNGLLISDFLGMLSRLNCSLTTIHLDGIPENSVNLMISDALGIVPRLCVSLSSVVYRKTGGNPFFVREFLRTLVDKGLVTYSLRQRRWLWDVDKVFDVPVTNNVLQLIAAKMNSLPNDAQMALKVASCFGIKVLASVIKSLSETDQYSTLQVDIDNAVKEGLIDFDGKCYKFAHDKVREASYELIGDADRKRFHFEIGMAIYSSSVFQDDDDDKLFTTAEQINYGVPSLVCGELHRISISKLNHKAGLTSMKRWDFGGSFKYMQAARSLLSADSWTTHYDFTLDLHYQLAKAAYPCGAIDVAKSVLNEIDQRGRCLEDKLDAFDLLVRMLQHHQGDLSLALKTCCNTLKLLGEDVPNDTELSAMTQIIELARTRIYSSFVSSSDMLNMPRTTCRQSAEIMRFYYQLALVSYSSKATSTHSMRRLLCGYYISRWVSYCLNQKVVCKHTPVALGFCK
jgi:predicted ATPase